MARNDLDATDTILAMLVAVIFTFPTAALHGLVFSKAWEWFVAPTFHITNLSVVQAIAISWIVSFVTAKRDKNPVTEGVWERLGADVFSSLFLSGFFFLMFWALTLFGS